MYKLLFLSLGFIFLWNCASKSTNTSAPKESLYQILEKQQCPSGDFRGWGIAEEERPAIDRAIAEIAVSMQDTISVRDSLTNEVIDEKARTYYFSQIIRNSTINNASDVKIAFRKQQENEIGVVACLSKADAAKSFIERQRLVLDSLGFVSNTALNTEHPKYKNEAWRRTKMLYNDFMRSQYVLRGWGISSPYSAEEIYAKADENYKNYCKSVKVFWQDAGNECSDAVFATFSRKIKIEKSKCSGGLNLSFYCSEKCKSASFGIECSYDPSLAIEACGGEKYSMLKAPTPVKGGDMYNEAKAREKLADNLQKAAFLNEWENEVKQWVPQCSD
ncbi:MAG: hypothetical protein FWF67_07985 [Fibromonadales bacterium]|nr:hypothetical protein [Fibromonadales bacterium]